MINLKNIIFLIAIITTFPLLASQVDRGSEIESFLLAGNTYYQNGEFTEAIVEYEKIIEGGYISEVVYYNLGNAYYKTGKLGYAILNYERALQLDPNNEDIQYNLKIARARTIDKIEEIPQLYITRIWNTFLMSLSIHGWLTATFILYVSLLVFIAFYLLHRRLSVRRFSFVFGAVNLGALLFVLTILLVRINRENTTDYGILLQSTGLVKISPDPQSNDAFVLHEGVKFEVEDKINNWTKIKLADGKVGWLPDDVLEQI